MSMALVRHWITTGAIVDFALLVLVFEASALWVLRRARGARVSYLDILTLLLPGAFLLLALRSATAGGSPLWIGAFLTLALFAHIADLTRRWRTQRPSGWAARPQPRQVIAFETARAPVLRRIRTH
jgi:hypothetical protein